MSGLSKYFGYDTGAFDTLTPYDGYGLAYGGWEGSVLSACVCDNGFDGHDCSLVVCPHGDSPDSTNQQRFAVMVHVDFSDVTQSGDRAIRLVINGQTSGALSFSTTTPSSVDCIAALSLLDNVDSAGSTCVVAHNSGGGAVSPIDGSALPIYNAQLVIALAFPEGGNSINNWFGDHGGQVVDGKLSCYFTPAIPAGMRTSSACVVTPLDVLAMTLLSTPPAAATSYFIEVDGASSRDVPNTVKVTKHTAGAPAVTSVIATGAAMTASHLGTDIGDGVTVFWSSAAGHTPSALWVIDSTGIAAFPTYREWSSCSSSGVCSFDTGLCTCGAFHTGPACQISTLGGASLSSASTSPLLSFRAIPADYAANVLELS